MQPMGRAVPYAFLENVRQQFSHTYANEAASAGAFALNDDFAPLLANLMVRMASRRARSAAVALGSDRPRSRLCCSGHVLLAGLCCCCCHNKDLACVASSWWLDSHRAHRVGS